MLQSAAAAVDAHRLHRELPELADQLALGDFDVGKRAQDVQRIGVEEMDFVDNEHQPQAAVRFSGRCRLGLVGPDAARVVDQLVEVVALHDELLDLGLKLALEAQDKRDEAASLQAALDAAWAHADVRPTSSCFCEPYAVTKK